MKLKIAVEELSHALAARERLVSEEVFGADALAPDPAPAADASCHPRLETGELDLLRTAYGRLLGQGEFADVLDLLGGSERFVPDGSVGSLHAPSPAAGRADGHRRIMLQVSGELDEQPLLPFEDEAFDAALVTLDVGALRRPLEVFREVGRVLRTGGLVIVGFGPARPDPAHTRLWNEADDRERLMLAEAFLEFAGAGFTAPTSITLFQGEEGLEWREGRAPLDEPDATRAHVVFAYQEIVAPAHRDHPPFPPPAPQPAKTKDDIRLDPSGRPCCPYCQSPMGRYQPPVTIFEIDYGVDELLVCFDDRCGYYRRSRRWMRSQGHAGFTYRFSFNPATGATGPLPDNLSGGLRSCRVD